MFTRGNGIHGYDISHLTHFVLPEKLFKTKMAVGTAVRGELIIPRSAFKTIEDKYANGRNAVAGLVNSKRYSVTIADLTQFVAYSIYHPPMKCSEQMKQLTKFGFHTVFHRNVKRLTNKSLSQLLIKRRTEGEYEIDGIVVSNDQKYPISGGNPRHSFAFKAVLTDQMAETKVTSVNWAISMDGRLVPTVTVEPVHLVGVTIENATAHNAKYVVDHVLGPGAVIKLIRSKDVIPYILEVLSPAPNKKPSLPEYKFRWSKSNVDLFLADPEKFQEVTVKRIAHFFRTMEIKHISEETIKKLVDHGYDRVDKTLKGIRDQDPEILAIDKVGERMLIRIWGEVTKCFTGAYLYQVMAGSKMFGRGMGVGRLKLITQRYPDIMTDKSKRRGLLEKIMKIDGFDLITATLFVDNLDKYRLFHKQLGKVVDLSQLKNFQSTGSQRFQGHKIVFTGFRDKDLKEYLETNGGKVSGSVSSKTTILVYTDPSSSKYKKAKDLKAHCYSYHDFLEKFYQKKGTPPPPSESSPKKTKSKAKVKTIKPPKKRISV